MNEHRLESNQPQIGELVGSFIDTVRSSDSRETALTDYLKEWIDRFDVIDTVAGDFGIYMLAVALIFVKFHEDPNDFGKNAESIRSIVGNERSPCPLPEALDPLRWKEWVFRCQRGATPWDV